MDQPTSFRAGDSVTWTVSLPDYPASVGWVLKYRLLSAASAAVDITATADGDSFLVALSPDDTESWTPGNATLVALVEKGDQRITLSASPVTILANLGAVTNFDGRSRNEKALDDAEAALAKYLASGKMHVAEYEIDGRHMIFRDVQEIKDLIALFRVAVNKEHTLQSLINGDQPPGRCYYRG